STFRATRCVRAPTVCFSPGRRKVTTRSPSAPASNALFSARESRGFILGRRFADAVGQVLRRARRARGFTLRDVHVRSRGRFKPSAVGGYERGERAISLDRFSQLAELYDCPPD